MQGEYIYITAILIVTLASVSYLHFLIKKHSLPPEFTLLIMTENCQEIIEGILREVWIFTLLYPYCEVIVIDRFSSDDTYKILKRLAREYNFLLLRDGPDGHSAYITGKKYSLGKTIYLLSVSKHDSIKKTGSWLKKIKKDCLERIYYSIVI